MISIIIPVYNQAKKLAECLKSIAGQTYDNYEIIIVNDGSTDQIDYILKDFKKKFGYKLTIFNQKNKGPNPARNKGAKLSHGEFLMFCDADITMNPFMLEKMINTLSDNPDYSYIYSSFKFGSKTFKLWPFDAGKLKQMPYIHTTTLIKRDHFPGFDEEIKRFQDWDLYLTMLAKGYKGYWINEILFKIKTGGTISSWLPSSAYRFLPFLPIVKKYNRAKNIIKQKHNLE